MPSRWRCVKRAAVFVSGHLSSEEVYNDFLMYRPDTFSILINAHKYLVQIADHTAARLSL